GGTATVDGGAGALRALEEAEVLPGRIVVACDARSAWESAAPAFGPQKGADAETTKRLAARLDRLAPQLPKDPRGVPFTGCGGGLSGALWSVLGAGLVAGAPLVLDAIGFDAAMRGARFVVTGEGRLDEQTLQGKAAGEVATRCRQSGVGCHAVVGQARLELFQERILDLQSVTQATTLEELERAGECLAP
nr:glycerate kinase [Thermoleophilaceae bacterium]